MAKLMRSARVIATSMAGAGVIIAAAMAMRGAAPPAQLGPTPVLVELFTSHGCSSCPPADELLSSMQHDPPLRGHVILLAYHVDYWDQLGWRDPFSSKAWTQRQNDYVRAFHLESPYTPQAVVDGTEFMVGSDARRLYGAVVQESQRKAAANVRVDVKDGVAEVHAEGGARAELQLAVYEDGITTRITRGENAGRTLTNDAVVRQLSRVAVLDGKPLDRRIALTLDPSWNRARLGVVAFVQEPGSRRVEAVASARVLPR
jgi:hypothetical protein